MCEYVQLPEPSSSSSSLLSSVKAGKYIEDDRTAIKLGGKETSCDLTTSSAGSALSLPDNLYNI